jgi:manganese/zinc/iron transport system permease protein
MNWASSALPSAMVAAILLGLACGLLGTFVVVRRMALTGDMLAHAVLPGVVAGLAWSATRNPLTVVAFAVAAGVAGSLSMTAILRHSRLKPDVALALVLSVFFALGIAMISRLQPAGVHAFLYGQIAAIDRSDLLLLAAVSSFTLLAVPAVFPLLRVTAFDPMFSRLLGLPVRLLEAVFFFVLSVVIVVSMQAVGVILVTAMLVTPAAAARFWTHSLARTAAIACGFGALGGVGGVWLSTLREGLPTGPLMALSVTGIFAASGVFGGNGGWLPRRLRQRRERLRIRGEDILKHLWHAEEAVGGTGGRSEADVLRAVGNASRPAMRVFLSKGFLERGADSLKLTPAGRRRARELVRSHRLWERYLTERAAYKADHVHDEAERVEHWIDAPGRERLAARLGFPTRDPHGSPIPAEKEEPK